MRHHRKEVYTNTNEATSATPAQTYAMLEHLINGEFEPSVVDMTAATPLPFSDAAPADIIDAQVQTANWLKGGKELFCLTGHRPATPEHTASAS